MAHPAVQLVGQPRERVVEVLGRDVAQGGDSQQPGRPLAGGPPVAVRAVGVGVVHAGVEHQQPQAGRSRVQRHLFDVEAAVVQEQRVAGGRPQRRDLVHHPGRRADEVVLGDERELRQLVGAQAGAVQRVEGGGHRALQRVRRREPAAERHPAVDQDVCAGHRVPGLPRRPDHPGDVGRPAAGAPGCQVVQ